MQITLKRATVLAGAVAAFAGAVTASVAAWPYVEPYVVAHRGYVIQRVGDVQSNINELMVWKNEDARDRAKQEAGQLDILLKKEQDPQIKALIEQNLERANQDAEKYERRVRSLRVR